MLSLCKRVEQQPRDRDVGRLPALGASPLEHVDRRVHPGAVDQRHDGIRNEERRHVVVQVLRHLVQQRPQLGGGVGARVERRTEVEARVLEIGGLDAPPRPPGPENPRGEQRLAHRAGVREARRGVLLHRAGDHGRDRGRDVSSPSGAGSSWTTEYSTAGMVAPGKGRRPDRSS